MGDMTAACPRCGSTDPAVRRTYTDAESGQCFPCPNDEWHDRPTEAVQGLLLAHAIDMLNEWADESAEGLPDGHPEWEDVGILRFAADTLARLPIQREAGGALAARLATYPADADDLVALARWDQTR